jgi:hypothetical protein
MKTIMLSSLAAVLMASALPALARDHAPRDPGVNARQFSQQQRIGQGVGSGKLTPRETVRLEREQARIRAEERRYKSDGVLTRAERADLQRDLNAANRHIYNEKHDGQNMPWAGGQPGNPTTRDPGVNARQYNQQGRIAQGIRSGELTRDEAAELRQEQRAVRQEERLYKSDGVLTKAERKDLHQDLNAASGNIYEEKHDAERR